MEINPHRRICRIIGGLRGLRKAGHDAERHLARRALAVQDRLIQREADALREHFHDPARKVDVIVLEDRVAHRHIAGDFKAVKRDLIKNKGQLVDSAAHLRPHRFRHRTGNGLARLAVDVADTHAIQQLRVSVHVFRDHVEENDRNRELCAGYAALLALHAAQLRKKFAYFLAGDDFAALLHRQRVKRTSAHGQSADVDIGFHFSFRPFFCEMVFFASGRSSCLGLGKLRFKALDLACQRSLFCFVRSLVRVEGLYLFGDGLLLLRRFCFVDRRLKFSLARGKLRVLLAERFQLGLLLLNAAAQHDCFKCHCLLLSGGFSSLPAIPLFCVFLPAQNLFGAPLPRYPHKPGTLRRKPRIVSRP